MAKQVLPLEWVKTEQLGSQMFTCGFCDLFVASERGYSTTIGHGIGIKICPHCKRPTFFEDGAQHPGVAFGASVKELPTGIAALYDESRVCCSSTAYTAAVLTLRKLLMNIAVHKGAAEGLKFIEYVEHLSSMGYVPPDGKGWVDHIRKKGNEANHEITLMNKADAEELIVFSEMLLKFIYEFPKRVPQTPTT